MLGFAQQEGKGRGGHAWWMLVAGEGPDEDLARGGADRPVVAARKGRPRERERERERERGRCTGGKKIKGGDGLTAGPGRNNQQGTGSEALRLGLDFFIYIFFTFLQKYTSE